MNRSQRRRYEQSHPHHRAWDVFAAVLFGAVLWIAGAALYKSCERPLAASDRRVAW